MVHLDLPLNCQDNHSSYKRFLRGRRETTTEMMSLGIRSLAALLVASCVRSSLTNQATPFLVQSFAAVDNQGQPIIPPDSVNEVQFEKCPDGGYEIHGKVSSMTITPCQRAHPAAPCTFVKGSNYTIQFIFQTSLSSDTPRSSVEATDDKGTYAYSGQSFNGCTYAVCPIHANCTSSYTYHFRTLASSFNHLTFNLTQGVKGPSMFCAGTRITFRDK